MSKNLRYQVFLPYNLQTKLAIIMPAFNEEEIISSVINEWASVAAKCQGTLVIINDGSIDSTVKIAKELMHEYSNLAIIDKENSGHGSTCLMGYNWAIENEFEWIFQTDSDAQTKASEFLEFWKRREEGPFIFGYRSRRKDGVGRIIISKVLKFVIYFILGSFLKDANVPFRLMNAKALAPLLAKVNFEIILANAFLAAIIAKHSKIIWMEISFLPRLTGVWSIRWKRIFSIGLKITLNFWKYRSQIK